ncbi:MAG: NrpR regulatory domain-containing protein [Spirochaetales bacterium]|uniref:NrpR regulatory domain-containing protein n=1 Tax=Candidatus Thalassospirochaeta sargassi TaxID=3119039 RepID=A0AAJ1IJA1_9SPIO|nr:NrpR regulatory domain-containing protein [Spirochaetales bacterium]
MKDRIEKKRLAILRVLRDAGEPLASNIITDELLDLGYDISPRTIRHHLKSMDEEGLTEYSEKHGRFITATGIRELEASRVFEKVGFLNTRIEQMAWRMDFDIRNQKGSVIINISYIKKTELDKAVELLIPVYRTGYTMGQLIRLYKEGEQTGIYTVPEGYIGIGTVCSFTLNGVLTKNGIPVQSRFGGLLQIEGGDPTRFVEIINYDGTSIDPLEIFIQSRMLDFSEISESGRGRIGANLFEIPSEARRQAARIAGRLEKLGLGNVLKFGYPEHPLLEIPINVGRAGGIAIGGLNPIAALIENNFTVISHAVSDITDFSSLFHFSSLPQRIQYFR